MEECKHGIPINKVCWACTHPGKEAVSNSALSDGLCAELSLMLDVFNSCIETKALPKVESPCQKKIIELMEQCGRKPTALKVRGT